MESPDGTGTDDPSSMTCAAKSWLLVPAPGAVDLLAAGAAIFLVVLGFQVRSDGLRDVLGRRVA